MMKRCLLTCAACVLLATASLAQDVNHFDLGLVFNADVVVNDGAGGLDPVQDPIDLGLSPQGNFAFMTQSVSDAEAPPTPDGLPNDGLIVGSPAGFDVQLSYRNDDDGVNAVRIAAMSDTFDFVVPPGSYEEVHVFATTGDGSSDVTIELEYSDGTFDSRSDVVPDWFDDPADTSDRYRLIDGRDRMNPGSPPGTPFDYEDNNDPAIFGVVILADPSKTLLRVIVSKDDTTGALNVFGASGVLAETCCSTCALADLLRPVLSPAVPPPSTWPCLTVSVPDVPTAECCEALEQLLPILPSATALPSTHPCVLLGG